MSAVLDAFAAEVGADDPVTIVGRGTQADGCAGARPVRAPAGIERVDPAEMVAACGAGTPLAELEETLASVGQRVALPSGSAGTVGGALATGLADERLLGLGPVRDSLLQMHYISAAGVVVMAGGPTVKNVSGFDLCRLFVGARGTLGFLGRVLLRTRPLPRFAQWYEAPAESRPELERRVGTLHRPTSVAWDGRVVRVLLEGHELDVAAQSRLAGLREADHQGPLPVTGMVRRTGVPDATGGAFVEWVGTGVRFVAEGGSAAPPLAPRVAALVRRIKDQFDPRGRLNPGRETEVGA